jgi:hypothetical protein
MIARGLHLSAAAMHPELPSQPDGSVRSARSNPWRRGEPSQVHSGALIDSSQQKRSTHRYRCTQERSEVTLQYHSQRVEVAAERSLAARPIAPGAMRTDLSTGALSRHIGRQFSRAAVLDQPGERNPRNRVLGLARDSPAVEAGDCRGPISERRCYPNRSSQWRAGNVGKRWATFGG